MHHKRKRPKNRRAGCLMCKPHKMNRAKRNRQDRAFTGPHRMHRLPERIEMEER